MTKADRLRKTFEGKSDDWIIELLANEVEKKDIIIDTLSSERKRLQNHANAVEASCNDTIQSILKDMRSSIDNRVLNLKEGMLTCDLKREEFITKIK